jgi:hypothetical protein
MSCIHKQNVNFKFQPPSTFVFFLFAKAAELKAVHPLEISQDTKLHGTMLIGESFASTSEV